MNFKISVVSAIYNTEKYLDEMISSVLNQTIGFEENIQLILVNDGSTDYSLEKCYKYASKYKRNICVIDTSHRGVSHARNIGIEYASGKYINFLDSDDKLEENCLSELYSFLECNSEKVDLVAMPIKFFDAEQGNHILNNKFKENRVIDIRVDPKYIQLSASSTLIKREALENNKFVEGMKYAEDALLITEIIMKKKKYGVITDGHYYYRRRPDSSSTIQQGKYNSDWYITYIKQFSLEVIARNRSKLGIVPLYIQYLVMYDLQWRINEISRQKFLTVEQKLSFFRSLKEVLKDINIKVLIDQTNINLVNKIKLVLLKLRCLRSK